MRREGPLKVEDMFAGRESLPMSTPQLPVIEAHGSRRSLCMCLNLSRKNFRNEVGILFNFDC